MPVRVDDTLYETERPPRLRVLGDWNTPSSRRLRCRSSGVVQGQRQGAKPREIATSQIVRPAMRAGFAGAPKPSFTSGVGASVKPKGSPRGDRQAQSPESERSFLSVVK